MGFLDKLRRKKDETVEKVKEQTTPQPTHPTSAKESKGILLKENRSTNKTKLYFFYYGCCSASNCWWRERTSSKQV